MGVSGPFGDSTVELMLDFRFRHSRASLPLTLSPAWRCKRGVRSKRPEKSPREKSVCFAYLWLVGNGGMGYSYISYKYYYYHSSIPY